MELLTERARIVPYIEEHIPAILDMFAEPDSNLFIEPLLNGTEESYIERLQLNLKRNEDFLQYFSVFDKENGDFIGTLNLNEFDDTGYIQIGLHLVRKYWNKGYGFELCQPLVKYGFENRDIEALHWIFEIGHDVSKKLAGKLGFQAFLKMNLRGCDLEIWKLVRTS